jgi:8-oxo-dGTP pyrophosphatase MutT (NUDIX family)
MAFARTIWYHNKPLVLTSNAEAYCRAHPVAEGYLHLEGAFPRHYRLAFRHLEKAIGLGAIIEDASEGALMHGVHERFAPIDAGGGVVQNESGHVLMIYRRGKWDLPKGKRDEGEDIATCAVREVEEETGLHGVELREKVCDTYHIYSQRGQDLLKRTAWYLMSASGDQKLTPQAAENILEVKWITPEAMGPVLFKSYEAIRQVLECAGVRPRH